MWFPYLLVQETVKNCHNKPLKEAEKQQPKEKVLSVRTLENTAEKHLHTHDIVTVVCVCVRACV